MQQTTGEIISDVLKFSVNVSSNLAEIDTAKRAQARFYLQSVATLGNRYAPFPYKVASGTVSLTASQATGLPSDFYHMGEWGTVFISGQIGAQLQQVSYQQMALLRRNSANQLTTMPTCYSIFGLDSSGNPNIQVYPLCTATLLIDNYVKKTQEMVDRPDKCFSVASGLTGPLTGEYFWRIVFTTDSGSTELGLVSTSLTLSSGIADLTGIATSPCHSVNARKVYRNKSGNANRFYLVDTIANNYETSYTDSTPDVDLGDEAPPITEAITGAEQFPPDFSERFFVQGLAAYFARTVGDVRDTSWLAEMEKEIRAFWGEMQEGRNAPSILPAFGSSGVGGYRSFRSMFPTS